MGPIDMQLVPALQSAIDDDALELHYQPEIDLASGAVVGMEALVRWNHPDRGLLWPEDFLPVAEAAGLLALIDTWVLEQGVVELARWQRLGGPPPEHPRQLWVNVSATQLGAAGFADWVGRVISDAGLPPGVLGLEVTEEALARNERVAPGVLRDLRAAGAALAVDDFGAWYSSLASLQELPVDAVKLDRQFGRGVGSDLEDDSIAASVSRLAHAHHLYVVAEGVEAWTEGARLRELGCGRAHGYVFSAPQRAERARWMLVRGTGWRAGYPVLSLTPSQVLQPSPPEGENAGGQTAPPSRTP